MSDTPSAPTQPPFDFAVFIGESRQVQASLVKTIDDLRDDLKEFRKEVKDDFGGLKDTVVDHGGRIGILEAEVASMKDTQAKQAETIAPIKLHPAVITGIILAPIMAVASLVATIIIAISK